MQTGQSMCIAKGALGQLYVCLPFLCIPVCFPKQQKSPHYKMRSTVFLRL